MLLQPLVARTFAVANPDPRRRGQRAVAYLLAAWSLAYMLPHLYWAAGGTAGFTALHPSIAWFPQWRMINWIASLLLTGAALLGLAFAWTWRPAIRRLLCLGALIGCSIATAHGLVGIAQRLHTIAGWPAHSSTNGPASWLLWDLLIFEPWFLIEGILFGVAGYLLAQDRQARLKWTAACIAGIALGVVTAVLRVKVG